VIQLDRRAEPDEQVTDEDAKDAGRLARVLMRLLRDVAILRRRWAPRRVDFEDVEVDATATVFYRFPHDFNGRVRWWVVDWSGGAAPSLLRDGRSDQNALVLVSTSAGTATIRVEEAG
jgi:hypothetical protein